MESGNHHHHDVTDDDDDDGACVRVCGGRRFGVDLSDPGAIGCLVDLGICERPRHGAADVVDLVHRELLVLGLFSQFFSGNHDGDGALGHQVIRK